MFWLLAASRRKSWPERLIPNCRIATELKEVCKDPEVLLAISGLARGACTNRLAEAVEVSPMAGADAGTGAVPVSCLARWPPSPDSNCVCAAHDERSCLSWQARVELATSDEVHAAWTSLLDGMRGAEATLLSMLREVFAPCPVLAPPSPLSPVCKADKEVEEMRVFGPAVGLRQVISEDGEGITPCLGHNDPEVAEAQPPAGAMVLSMLPCASCPAAVKCMARDCC